MIKFAPRNVTPKPQLKEPYHVLVVDDELDIHYTTKLVLDDLVVDGHPIVCHSAFSGEEAKRILERHPNYALAIVDVIMESIHAGFEVVRHVRNNLANRRLEIIIHTGQPGTQKADEIKASQDISDFLPKNEATAQRLSQAVVQSLRHFGQPSPMA